jgi:hypothetical protein
MKPTEDRIRILRVVQYTGPRAAVEHQVKMSLHGSKYIQTTGVTITAVTIEEFPEVLDTAPYLPDEDPQN